MAEYIDKNKLDMAFVDRCAGDCGCCSYWEMESYGHDCNLIHNFPPEDVVEREKIDKAIEEAIPLDVIISCKQELITKIIEYSGSGNEVTQAYCNGFKDSLEILDKLIESEEEE